MNVGEGVARSNLKLGGPFAESGSWIEVKGSEGVVESRLYVKNRTIPSTSPAVKGKTQRFKRFNILMVGRPRGRF